jgi:HK97 gp10 family phage protein
MAGGARITKMQYRKIVEGEMRPKAEAIVEKFARDIANWAAVNAPYQYGVLSASIQPARMGPLMWRVNVGAEYGLYQEYGTRYMAAQPFLIPATEDHRSSFFDAMVAVFGYGISTRD